MRLKTTLGIILSLFLLTLGFNAMADLREIKLAPDASPKEEVENEIEECDKVVLSFETLWHSKFADVGRDSLEKGGIFTLGGGVEFSGLAINFEYILNDNKDAAGENMDYRESNTSIRYGVDFLDFEAYLGYNRKELIEEKWQDDEIMAGFSYAGLSFMTAGVDYIYSHSLEGSFAEVYVEGELNFLEELVTLSPYIMEAFDFGYATKNYNGANHLQIGLRAGLAMGGHFDLVASINQALAHGDIKKQLDDADSDETGNFTWGSIGVSGEF